MEALQLIEANPDPTKSAVMTRAAELVAEGYDRSTAMRMSWDDILGDDFGLEDSEDEPYDFDEMLQMNKPTRRNSTMENPLEQGGIGTLALLGSLGYLLWCAIGYSKTKVWSWTPWKTPVSVSRRLAELNAVKPPSNNGWEQQVVTLIVP